MDTNAFRDGIAELKKFYSTFKPSGEQLEAWFSRLHNRFDNETFINAVYHITETQATNPSYNSIKVACYQEIQKKKRENNKPVKADETIISDQKWDFQRDCMKELSSIIEKRMKNQINTEQKEKLLSELKTLWAQGYKQLPEAKQLIDLTVTRY